MLIVTALEQVGLTVLVMGGHAVRYHGLNRDTNDYDLHLPLRLILPAGVSAGAFTLGS